jgi:lysophospholipase L1-like esterase
MQTMVKLYSTKAGVSRNRRCRLGIVLLALVLMLGVSLFSAQLQRRKPSSTTMPTVVKAMSSTHRILCYGDSLTAGTSGMDLFPYAPYLEAKLKAMGRHAIVRHLGLPGLTSHQMLSDVDGGRTGLRTTIQAVQDPPLSLVILLVGTNDLGQGYPADEILKTILGLHQIAYETGVPRTIAIGIPPSGYQSVYQAAAELAVAVNSNIEEFCLQDKRASFMPFPFPYERAGENWNQDTLHFSQRGYQELGESLAPVVEGILQLLDEQGR